MVFFIPGANPGDSYIPRVVAAYAYRQRYILVVCIEAWISAVPEVSVIVNHPKRPRNRGDREFWRTFPHKMKAFYRNDRSSFGTVLTITPWMLLAFKSTCRYCRSGFAVRIASAHTVGWFEAVSGSGPSEFQRLVAMFGCSQVFNDFC